ncbi:putative Biotin carboxyl carrier protein of acetyl-CoA carboxylase [Melia azedarach]|uniref:Biotin carboxyl carrier protein of acetyl-CoA carboxylase n=1 Tax=Melia azedarach TaxID=155640 RepID=A0ACC1YA32_MELAZ|nr:putative Biotin carboxyl carrier protein of acetyl-CoA carboxylase [Melia azedarach]
MESSTVLRSFHCSAILHSGSLHERPGIVPVHNSRWAASNKSFKLISSPVKRYATALSSAKTSENIATAKNDVLLENTTESSLEKDTLRSATFPSGFEALMLEVCDETEIAELKLKVGDFEMHMKRNVGATKAPLSNISPTTPPPIPTKPMEVSAPIAPPPSPPKSSSEKAAPFINASFGKSSKLVALEASGSNGYVLVSSPTVGSFRRNRTVKGKKQPPICKEGDVIKEGQVIGYLDQFGTELPVKSDVAGEVLKLLFDDGDAVGYWRPSHRRFAIIS